MATPAKLELGRHLFYEKSLSNNRTQSCGTCHQQRLAFTDGLVTAVGSTGELHHRNTSTLTNVGYSSTLTWSNHLLTSLERQALIPLFGDEPLELALTSAQMLVARLQELPGYAERFRSAFPDDAEPVSLLNATRALAVFQRALISADSPYDRYLADDESALSAEARRGLRLFMSERLECFHCHGGFNFTDSVDHEGMAQPSRSSTTPASTVSTTKEAILREIKDCSTSPSIQTT